MVKKRGFGLLCAVCLTALAGAIGIAPSSSRAAAKECYAAPDIVTLKIAMSGKKPTVRLGVYPHASAWNIRLMLDGTPLPFRLHTNWHNELMQFYNLTLTPFVDHYDVGQSYRFTVEVRTDCGVSKASIHYRPKVVTDTKLRYVALGDSYSSGEGNPPFTGGKCHRSRDAWPVLLAWASTEFKLVANLACSGAHTDALFRSFQGQSPQFEHLKTLQPDIVTITIGGNDIGFGNIMLRCYVSDCVSDGRLRKAEANISRIRSRLTYAFRQLKAAVPKAKIFVVGYPRIFPANHSQTHKCGWLEPQERADLNTYAAELEAEEKLASQAAGVEYISVFNALEGHELCTKNSWLYPVGKLPLFADGHLKPWGQGAVAHIVRQHLG